MQDSAYIIFIAFGCLWILMGVIAVIALFKSEQRELRFGQTALLVTIPIILPIIIALLYQIARPSIMKHFFLGLSS